jgi:hypothetical protein
LGLPGKEDSPGPFLAITALELAAIYSGHEGAYARHAAGSIRPAYRGRLRGPTRNAKHTTSERFGGRNGTTLGVPHGRLTQSAESELCRERDSKRTMYSSQYM